MHAIVVTDQAAGVAGMTLVELRNRSSVGPRRGDQVAAASTSST
jgi:hypothetical protein